MSASVAALRCVRCQIDFPDDRMLAKHLVNSEMINASEALLMVRKAREIAEVRADPYGLDANGITKHEEPVPIDPDVAARAVAKQLGVKANDPIVQDVLEKTGVRPRAPKEPAMVKVKSEKDCAFCQRRKKANLGPCGWHGGEKYTKPEKEKRERALKRTKPPAETTDAPPSANGIAAHIRQLYADVERGKVAEAELADVKKALAGI